MISTSVAISAASSRPIGSTELRSVRTSISRIVAGVLLGEPFQRDQQESLAAHGVIWPSLLLDRPSYRAAARIRINGRSEFQIS